MSGLAFGLLCAVVVLFVLLLTACIRIERLMWEAHEMEADQMEADHSKCMALVAAFVGDQFAARVLEAAADDYDSTDGQAALRRIGTTVWTDEGTQSVPALWLAERAEKIRGGDATA